jgi:hypothetical protein
MSQPQPDAAALWVALQGDAVAFRDAALGVLKRWQYVQQSEADVDPELFRQFNLLATPALVYFGRATQDETFDFDEALAKARQGS